MPTPTNQPPDNFQVQVFDNVSDTRPACVWTGDVETFLQGNEDLDPDYVSRIRALCYGQSEVFDMGAGGVWKIRRV